MSLNIQASYPSYNNISNYSGTHASIKSAGRVNSVEQNDAIIALEREGRLNLSQFGLIKLPREVLFAQDIRESKVKATRLGDQVQTSSKTDADEDRTLSKVKDSADAFADLAPIKQEQDKDAANHHGEHAEDKNRFTPGAKPSNDEAETDDAAQKKSLSGIELRPELPSVTGNANSVYRTVQTASIPNTNGQQLSIVA